MSDTFFQHIVEAGCWMTFLQNRMTNDYVDRAASMIAQMMTTFLELILRMNAGCLGTVTFVQWLLVLDQSTI